MQNIDELEAFLLKHGENIVDMLGGEIDRIELKLKVIILFITFNKWLRLPMNNEFKLLQKKYPEIRHCDLEIL